MELELANVVYVFCPRFKKGIMFYDQSPSGAVAKFSGSLKEGEFYSSGEVIVEWDDNKNGVRTYEVKKSHISHKINIEVKNGDTFEATTILVPDEVFGDLCVQIKNPVFRGEYKFLDLNRILKKKM